MALPLRKKFFLPQELNASEPPEFRGMRRDQIKLMVTDKRTGTIEHAQFFHLDQYLKKGDILVLNNSRTIPASARATITRKRIVIAEAVEIRFAKKIGNNAWEVLALHEDIESGDVLNFSEGQLKGEISGRVEATPLWKVCFSQSEDRILHYLYQKGEPIRYEYTKHALDLNFYQTVYASVPGSVEMPSAGRAFTWEMLFNLQKKGVNLQFIQLHTGLSYLLDDYWPVKPETNPEIYQIPSETMDMIHHAKKEGRRVIAVGTTVVRALETALLTEELKGSTHLYIGPDYPMEAVDGILTGFHEPEASHLDMLTAFIDSDFLFKTYEEAVLKGYLWHEFGDVNLII